MIFQSETGIAVPTVDAETMREVDRVAVEVFGLDILQMMENAGRALAKHALMLRRPTKGPVVILAGGGNNGGGGLCCARHLHNHDVAVRVVLDRPPEALHSLARHQWHILDMAGFTPVPQEEVEPILHNASVIVDALIGYGLRGTPRPQVATLIRACNRSRAPILSLDVPSGLKTTGATTAGPVVHAQRVLTLALPKPALDSIDATLFLTDIGIPPEVYSRLGLVYSPPFGQEDWVKIWTE